MKKFQLASLAALCALAFSAQASQIITTGAGVSVGIQNNGALGVYDGTLGLVGIYKAGVGDGISPGCLCEGWGASIDAVSGWSANANGGDFNVAGQSFVSTATTATSVV